jgi:hypothetical protein
MALFSGLSSLSRSIVLMAAFFSSSERTVFGYSLPEAKLMKKERDAISNKIQHIVR